MVSKNMRLVTVHIPDGYIEGIEELVRLKLYPNKGEVIRIAVRDFLKHEAQILNITYFQLLGVE